MPRSACTSARASGEVIHWLVPSAAAERPSRVAANFQITYGRPRRDGGQPGDVASRAPRPRAPRSRPRRPAARSVVGAAGGDRGRVGDGDHHAADAGRDQRLAARAGAAGVVAGLQRDDGGAAAGPVAGLRRARTISACGPPAYAWKPSPTTSPAASSSTQPTTGLGLVVPRPRGGQRDRAAHRASSSGSPCRPPLRAVRHAPEGAGRRQEATPGYATRATRHGRAATRPSDPARCLPSGLSDRRLRICANRRPWSLTRSTGRRVDVRVAGLPRLAARGSPPVRNFTESRQRVVGMSQSATSASAGRTGDAVTPAATARHGLARRVAAAVDRDVRAGLALRDLLHLGGDRDHLARVGEPPPAGRHRHPDRER